MMVSGDEAAMVFGMETGASVAALDTHSIDLGRMSILDPLPSPLHHASRTLQVFILLLRQTTIILATIVVSPGIFLKNAPTLDKITPLSKGHPLANPSRASSKMGLRKDRMHKGVNR